ncbi:MAG TPA: PLP-dependent aminotransferase family protein [Thermomicrobiales bacterium]|nr:PLP-dependent aminotransferase family protein [Thermomicrobiales bacterium]
MGLDWERLRARRAPSLHGWVKTDVSYIWDTPNLIYLCDGAPAIEQVPIDFLRQAHADAWEDARSIMSYGESLGHQPLREAIGRHMGARGAEVSAELVLVTNGSQQGLDLIARALFDRGDIVIVEGPTYFGALQAFDAYEVEYRVASLDEHGLIPEALERLIAEEPRPKALYTVPAFQNPTGVSTTPERSRRIVEIARSANVAIIEDDPYGDIYFGGAAPAPLRAIDPDVIYLGTFSKTLAPALRMGWMVAPAEIFPLLANSKEAVDIMSDRFVQRAVASAASNGWLERHLNGARAFYRERRDTMLAALEREMPDGVSWTRPDGGFFLWVTLPDGIDAEDVLKASLTRGVGFLPGSCFYPDARIDSSFRLAYPTSPKERVDVGIQRIGLAIRDVLSGSETSRAVESGLVSAAGKFARGGG